MSLKRNKPLKSKTALKPVGKRGKRLRKGDRKVTKAVQSRGECQMAGLWGIPCKGDVVGCHVLGRDDEFMRHDPENIVDGCSSHHAYADTHQPDFHAWLNEKFDGRFDRLKARSNHVDPETGERMISQWRAA